MSMLTAQINELRLMGDGQAAKGEFAVATLLREAADTIESLRGRLQESCGQVPEQGKCDNGGERESCSRWYQLFGTPERAAKTVSAMCSHGIWSCDGCPLLDEGVEHCESELGDTPSLLEWLRGDAE